MTDESKACHGRRGGKEGGVRHKLRHA